MRLVEHAVFVSPTGLVLSWPGTWDNQTKTATKFMGYFFFVTFLKNEIIRKVLHFIFDMCCEGNQSFSD